MARWPRAEVIGFTGRSNALLDDISTFVPANTLPLHALAQN
jgi:hypothetical protein